MLAGSLCVAAAVLPPVASHDEVFTVHVAQHLLLGMAAPVFLALSAPSPSRCGLCRFATGACCCG
jgi:cytochrome c oxidase assembly factor CtaG